MEINNSINPPTFGWVYPMHTNILKEAAKTLPIDDKILKIMSKSVQQPDFDEAFLFWQRHFYYPTQKRKSFLDFTRTHNAKQTYLKHLREMDEDIKNKASATEIFDKAGRALHYLQDITQPNHTDAGGIIAKALARKALRQFEIETLDKQHEIFATVNPITLHSKNFEDLFDMTLQISHKNKVPTEENRTEWTIIAQRGVTNAVMATKKFLELLTENLINSR